MTNHCTEFLADPPVVAYGPTGSFTVASCDRNQYDTIHSLWLVTAPTGTTYYRVDIDVVSATSGPVVTISRGEYQAWLLVAHSQR